ncbi:Hypothetical predicted protein [Paramuricea clavata]|uniref:Uncharacterized protein n=1 Tax=Paramuricea clavata TaxID=317549 RepID=A0A6S7GUG2_PARCT|nr:Hypothetical predicted protein [Paramuricea clavata]
MNGDINGLLDEGRAIQKRKVRQSKQRSSDDTARVFAKLMMQGKVRAALRIISKDDRGCLTLDSCVAPDNPKTVRQVLLEKHPPNIPPVQSAILNGDCNMEPHPVIFDRIDGELIQNTAIKTEGAAGPSGLDAMAWRRLCTSFKSCSVGLCDALAAVARRICTAMHQVFEDKDADGVILVDATNAFNCLNRQTALLISSIFAQHYRRC